MSLNSVVNNLVRAAAGIPADITDSDLDAHVAKLLASEAKERESKWSELGLVGLLRDGGRDSPDPSLPKTNKRFLASVIRTVDGHNTALLRAQAQAAREARDERLGESSGSGRSRGTATGGASRLFGGALKGMSRGSQRQREEKASSSRYRSDQSSRDKERPLSRRIEEDDDSRRSGYIEHEDDARSHRRSNKYDSEEEYERHRSRRIREDKEEESDRRGRRRNSYDEGKKYPTSRHDGEREVDREKEKKRSRGSDYDRSPRQSNTSSTKNKRNLSPSALEHSIDHSRSRSPVSKTKTLSSPIRSLSPVPAHSSKMDRYFESTYDPRLDLPSVPSEGLVQEVGWDNMLAILKERGKKRRHQSPTLSDDPIPASPKGILPKTRRSISPDHSTKRAEKKERKAKREERKRRNNDDDSSEEERRQRRKAKKREKEKESKKEGAGTLLDGYEYVRKGGTREWDVGK